MDKTLKKNNGIILIVLTSVLMLSVVFIGLLSKSAGHSDPNNKIFSVSAYSAAAGIIAAFIVYYLIDKIRLPFAIFAYVVSFAAILWAHVENASKISFGNDATGNTRWLIFGDFALDIAAFLPLMILLFVFFMKAERKKIIFIPLLLIILPCALVLMMPNLTPVVIILADVFFIILYVNSKEKMKLGAMLIILISLVIAGVITVIVLKSDYFMSHVRKIFSGGDLLERYLGSGGEAGKIKIFGKTEISSFMSIRGYDYLTEHRRIELPVMLYSLGGGTFVIYILLMCGITALISLLIARKNNSYEKYAALCILIYFTIRFVYSILSQFVLTAALSSPPFIGGETSVCIDIILFGAMLGLLKDNNHGREII